MRTIPVGLYVLVALLAASPARAEDIEFPIVLGTYSTPLIGSLPARPDNTRLAARSLDSTVLEPAQVLSFNRRIGQRSIERGFQPAPVILHETRDVQVGGGVCQLASTLFDAALIAGLRTTERHRHSYPVDYIPLAQDATIVWGAKDLKILNCLDQRVRVLACLCVAGVASAAPADPALEAYRAFARSPRGERLLAVARGAMCRHWVEPAGTRDTTDIPWPGAPRGVYVSLSDGQSTRACVGSAAPYRGGLTETVRALAVQALQADRRHAPVRSEELTSLRVVISFAGPPEAVTDPMQIDPGREGLLISS